MLKGMLVDVLRVDHSQSAPDALRHSMEFFDVIQMGSIAALKFFVIQGDLLGNGLGF